MKYLMLVLGLLVSLNIQAQKTMRLDKIYLNESLELKKIYSGDTLVFLIQNKVSGTGMNISINSASVKFDVSATDLGFFLNYTNGDTNTFDVRNGGVLLQWGANDGNVGIGTQTPTEKLHVVGTSLFTDTLTYDIPSAATGLVLTALDTSGNATWQDNTAYGEMGFGDSTVTQALTQNVWQVVTNSNKTLWQTAAQDTHNVQYSGDSLIIGKAGTYQLNTQLSIDGTNGSIIRLGVYLNGSLACACTGYQELTNNHIIQLNYINVDTLAQGDVIKVVIMNTANNDDVNAISGKITLVKIR